VARGFDALFECGACREALLFEGLLVTARGLLVAGKGRPIWRLPGMRAASLGRVGSS